MGGTDNLKTIIAHNWVFVFYLHRRLLVRFRGRVTENIGRSENQRGEMSGRNGNDAVRLNRLEGPGTAGFRRKKALCGEPGLLKWRCGDITNKTVLPIRLSPFPRNTQYPPALHNPGPGDVS